MYFFLYICTLLLTINPKLYENLQDETTEDYIATAMRCKVVSLTSRLANEYDPSTESGLINISGGETIPANQGESKSYSFEEEEESTNPWGE